MVKYKFVESWYSENKVELSDLIGKTLVKVTEEYDTVKFSEKGFVLFEDDQGNCYGLAHFQDCCEGVWLDDREGDWDNLIGSPILVAEESSSWGVTEEDYGDSYTWTFYKFATIKGHIDLKFYGTSNGYYSERVDFCKVEKVEE